ncbi:putative High mobility group protein HMGA, plant [Rosa chinensis]|uniref:Putative High mobility group protein HMGA, plant n=2 Tax=Rosa chinensis TaxID=74649 RepID=A0A2P6P974_ROSCH|nr:putative High mobility group protein HMGA, plant [Rosa chinensis]
MINKLAGAVMEKLAFSDPSKTLTPDQKNDIKRRLCRLLPAFHTPDHPTYAVMIRRAIEELNEEQGSTEEAISKYIREKFDGLPLAHASFLSLHLKKLNERGEIVCVSKNCYMLPTDKGDSLSRRKCVPKQKKTRKGWGKGNSAKGNEHKTLAEEQVEVTEKQRKQRKQSQKPQYCKAVDNQTGSPEQVNGQQCQRQMEEIAAIAEKKSQEQIEEDQQSKVIDDKKESPDAQQGEVIKQQIQGIAVIVVPRNSAEQIYKVPEEQEVEVTEQQQQHGQQSQELSQEEQHSIVIDCQNGSPDEENVQQDEVNRLKSQNQVQLPGVIVEKQNIEQIYKEDEVQVEVTEQLREDGQEIQDSIQAEQCSKMIEDKYGSTDAQQERVNGHENQKHMQDVALIVDKQNVEVKKYQVNEEQVEVIEQKVEHVKQSAEPIQHMKVIDCQNGSSKQQNEQKDEVNGQQSENQMQVTAVVVEKSNFSEQTRNVNEEEQVEMTAQREYGQQSQEEQHNKVIDCQNGSPEQQNKQQEYVNEDQLQEIIVSCEKQIDTKLKHKVADERIEVSMDKIVEEQYQTKEQLCEVIEQHSQAVKRDIQLHGEAVEAIRSGPEAQQSDMISEQNRLQDQIELTSMQELLPEKQEKDAATVVNSNVSIASQKFSHHVSSNLSELLENNVKVQGKMQKLLENNIKVQEKTHKLLENNIKVQEKTLQVQEKLFELLKELADTIRNPVIEKRSMPIIGPCGEREYIDCGFPAKQKHQPEISAQTKALGSQLNEMLASLELPMDAAELFLKQGKLCNLGQQQVPKGQNKSIKNMPDAEQPQQQEIGNSELLRELPTMEEENEELSGPDRKRIRLSIEANHEKEKQLQVHNAEGHPDLRSQEKPSVSVLVPSFPDVFLHSPNYERGTQQPKVQKTERPREIKLLSVEGGIIAHVSRTNLIESSVDLLQEEQEIVPELTYQENLQEQEQEMQSFSHKKHQQAILSDVVKTPDFLLATGAEQEAENVIKDKDVELDLTASDQSCRTQPEQKQQQRQLGLPGKQPSESYCEGAEASKYQDEDHQPENVIKEKAVQSSHLSLELTASEQSSQRQLEKQQQQPQRRLRPRGKKSAESDCGVATAPECQEQQPRYPMQERMKLDQKPAGQSQLSPWCQRHSESELSLTTSMVELSPRKSQDTESQTEEKTRELKTSAEETGQRQLQQRQLRTRSKNLSEFKQTSLSNTGMSQVDKPGAEDSSQLKRQPQVEKPGVGDPSQLKKKQVNRLNKRQWCTPEPTTMPNAIGAIVTYQRRSSQTIEPNPEAFQDLGPTLADHLEQKENHHGQRKKFKSAKESPDELALTSQHLVVDPHILVKPPLLNPAAVGQLPQTTKELPQKQQLLHHMKLRSCSQAASQSEPDVLIVGLLPQTTKELPQKQLLRHMKLHSRSQAASQSEPDVSMIDTLPAEHHSEQPQEQKHPKWPQKQRGRTPKPKLDRAGPVKRQQLQEQPKRRGRPPKLDVNTISGRKLISKNKQKQPKSPGKAKSRKVIKGKLQSQVRGKPQKVTQGTPKSQVRGKPQKVTQGTPKSQVRGRLQKMSEETVKSQVRERAREVTEGT